MQEWVGTLAQLPVPVLERPVDDFDRKHSIVRRWSLDIDAAVFVDLIRLYPNRHVAPRGSHWTINIDWSSQRGVQWWLPYALSLHAIAECPEVIFYDDNAFALVNGIEFLTSRPDELIRHMERVLVGECDPSELLAKGFTRADNPWCPHNFEMIHLLARSPSEACEEAIRVYQAESAARLANRSLGGNLRRWTTGLLLWCHGNRQTANNE